MKILDTGLVYNPDTKSYIGSAAAPVIVSAGEPIAIASKLLDEHGDLIKYLNTDREPLNALIPVSAVQSSSVAPTFDEIIDWLRTIEKSGWQLTASHFASVTEPNHDNPEWFGAVSEVTMQITVKHPDAP